MKKRNFACPARFARLGVNLSLTASDMENEDDVNIQHPIHHGTVCKG